MTNKKTIDRNTYLKAIGLFHLATERYRMVRECEAELRGLLGPDEDAVILDQIFEPDGSLDKALKVMGVETEPQRME